MVKYIISLKYCLEVPGGICITGNTDFILELAISILLFVPVFLPQNSASAFG